MYEKLVCDGCNAQMEIGEMAYVLMGGDVIERDEYPDVSTEACWEGGGQKYYCPSCIERKERALTELSRTIKGEGFELAIIPTGYVATSDAMLNFISQKGYGIQDSDFTVATAYGLDKLEEAFEEDDFDDDEERLAKQLKAILEAAKADTAGEGMDVIFYAEGK